LRIRNDVIEYELALRPESWNDYLPQSIIDKYRYPANLEELISGKSGSGIYPFTLTIVIKIIHPAVSFYKGIIEGS